MDAPVAWKRPVLRQKELAGYKIPVIRDEKLGYTHRRFRHDMRTVIIIFQHTRDPGAYIAALGHLLDDGVKLKP